MAILDLNKLPDIDNIKGILKYDPFDEFSELKNLGEISERIYGCALFNGGGTDDKYPHYLEKAYLRAALNEFVSISEMLKKHPPCIVIDKTDYPLFHFFKELRVTNFHIKTFMPNNIKGTAKIVNRTTGKTTLKDLIDIVNFIIEDCNLKLFSDNENYKRHYATEEFKKTVEWVEQNQRIWGINHIIEAALKQYCQLINVTLTNKAVHLSPSQA